MRGTGNALSGAVKKSVGGRTRLPHKDASPPPVGRRIAGLGRFTSGKPDLGSNKEHLKDCGR